MPRPLKLVVGPIDITKTIKIFCFADNPEEEQGDREEFASLVGNTSSRSGTLSRKDSLSENAIAQMSQFNKINTFKIYFYFRKYGGRSYGGS